jgi:hypothetical protein
MLTTELVKEEIDFIKVKKILRGIRVATPETSLEIIANNFHNLLPMAKEVVLILEEVKKSEHANKVVGLKKLFLKFYNEAPARNISIIRGWLMEAFTRGIFPLEISDLKSLNNLTTPLDVKQNYLLQGRLDRRTFFRNKKFELDGISITSRFAFLMGASCLPKEELKPFLDTVKKSTADPLMATFCAWLLSKHGGLFS